LSDSSWIKLDIRHIIYHWALLLRDNGAPNKYTKTTNK
jgi:hypothetical protein